MQNVLELTIRLTRPATRIPTNKIKGFMTCLHRTSWGRFDDPTLVLPLTK